MEEKKKKFIFDEKDIVQNGLLAAIYVVLTYVMAPISFGAIQFRFSEILVLACFFDKKKAVGLTIGCFIANLVSPLGLMDLGFGTAATLLACLGIMFSKHLIIAILFPVIANGLIVGYILIMILKRDKCLFSIIRAKQNIDFNFRSKYE